MGDPYGTFLGDGDYDGGPVAIVIQLRHADEDLGFDYECETYPGELGEMRLMRMTPGGPCDRAGVPAGIVATLNNRPVHSVADLRAAVRSVRQQGLLDFELTMYPEEDMSEWEEHDRGRRPRRSRRSRHNSRGRRGRHSRNRSRSRGDFAYGDGDLDSNLASRLRHIASRRQRGQLSEQAYREQKREILDMLSDGLGYDVGSPPAGSMGYPGTAGPAAYGVPGPYVPTPAGVHLRSRSGDGVPGMPHAGPRHIGGAGAATAPPTPWARVTIPRYVFLRSAPFKGSEYVGAPGVTGVVGVAHVHGKFALLNHPQIGYIQTKYLQFVSSPTDSVAAPYASQRRASAPPVVGALAPPPLSLYNDPSLQSTGQWPATQHSTYAGSMHPSTSAPIPSNMQFDNRPMHSAATSEPFWGSPPSGTAAGAPGSPALGGRSSSPLLAASALLQPGAGPPPGHTPAGHSSWAQPRVPSPLPADTGAVDWGGDDPTAGGAYAGYGGQPHDPLALQTTTIPQGMAASPYPPHSQYSLHHSVPAAAPPAGPYVFADQHQTAT